MTKAHSETVQMAVCCQNLMLGALSSHSTLSMLVGTLFKKFGLYLNMPRMTSSPKDFFCCRAAVGICTACGDVTFSAQSSEQTGAWFVL